MCADLTGRRFVEHSSPRPNDLGWYVTPLQGLRGRAKKSSQTNLIFNLAFIYLILTGLHMTPPLSYGCLGE